MDEERKGILDRERPLMEHLQELKKRLFKIGIAVGIITILTIAINIQMYDFNGSKIPVPIPDPLHNISTQVMTMMRENLLPKNVVLVQLAPGQAFFAQFQVAIFLGVILSMPVIVKELTGFIAPALYRNERETIKKITIPAVALFAAGCIFAYFVAIPIILKFLYQFGQSLGIQTFLNITDFINFVMQFLVVFGISYELPVIMWAATASGMVEPKFWRSNIRWAIFIMAIFGAVVTSDGSGVTMWFIAGPMILLYAIGMVFIEMKVKKKQELDSTVSEADSDKLKETAKSLGVADINKSDEELREEIDKLKQKDVSPKS